MGNVEQYLRDQNLISHLKADGFDVVGASETETLQSKPCALGFSVFLVHIIEIHFALKDPKKT